MEAKPNDEQILAALFKRYLPHPLYVQLDQARTASRLSWTQLPQQLAAKYLIKVEAPVPNLVPRATTPTPPKVVASPELVPVPWDESGVHESRRAG
jgi:hypothetical protein